MRDVRWYTTLALWKSIVFMEGNYKRALAGTTDDPYLKTVRRRASSSSPARPRRWHVAQPRSENGEHQDGDAPAASADGNGRGASPAC